MSPSAPRAHRDYHPLLEKTVENVLIQMFVDQFGFSDKRPIAALMVEHIMNALLSMLKPASLVSPGQMVMLVAACDGKKHTYKSIKHTKMVPVVVDLVTGDDILKLEKGEPMSTIRDERIARILLQAYRQGGVPSLSDVGLAVAMSPNRVSDIVLRHHKATGSALPYRGTIQDLGPSMSHKLEIIGLHEEGVIETEIARRTNHSPRSVTNYIRAYKNVLSLIEKGFTLLEVTRILSMSARLVDAYLEIAKKHHPALSTNLGGI